MDPKRDSPNDTFYDQLSKAVPTQPEIQVFMAAKPVPFPAGLREETRVGEMGSWSLVWAYDKLNMGAMPCQRFQPRVGLTPGSENGYRVEIGFRQFQDFYRRGYVEVYVGEFQISDPDANERAAIRVSSRDEIMN